MAVTCRFRWWQRLLLYGIWITILIFSDSIQFGARSTIDPGIALDRQILISAVGSGILLALAAFFVWLRRQELALLSGTVSITAEPRPPNILFIIADDQSPFDLKVYEPMSTLETPVLDRLAIEGMVFDSAHHMGAFVGAVCTPSRHMLMSGRTVWHLPIGPGAKSHCLPNLEQNTMAAVFNRAGYATMRTCKIGNSYEGANKQFTVRNSAYRWLHLIRPMTASPAKMVPHNFAGDGEPQQRAIGRRQQGAVSR